VGTTTRRQGKNGETGRTTSPLSQSAYDHIRQKLLRGEFPAAKRISEAAIAKELGISRTPVREAIRQLQSQGILYQVPSSGTFVAQPDRQQLIEAYEIRESLECLAVSKAVRRMAPAERVELRRLCDQMRAAVTAMRDAGEPFLAEDRLRQFLTADLSFHLLLLRAAGNRMALQIFAEAQIRDRVFGYRSHRRDLHHVAWVWLAHARIARAVQRRDARAARLAMRRHIRASLREAVAAFDQKLASQTPGRQAQSTLAAALDHLIEDLT
jgi:DNA-binding GntR family transcriptional regulator